MRGIKANESIKTIGITTNGVLLHRLLEPLAEAGLNSLNISLDTMVQEKFEFLTRRSAFIRVLSNIRTALNMPHLYPMVKINCVVMNGVNTDELNDFVELTRDQSNLAVRFIEYMPFSDNKWNEKKYFPYEEMLKIIRLKYQLEKLPSVDKNDTTKWFRVQEPSYHGRIGFITSMSEHFCSTCNRVRVTADGQLKVKLIEFSSGLLFQKSIFTRFVYSITRKFPFVKRSEVVGQMKKYIL